MQGSGGQFSVEVSSGAISSSHCSSEPSVECAACKDSKQARLTRRYLRSVTLMDKFILPVIPPVWWTWHERWRSAQDRLAEMLESRAFHTFIIILVVLDLGIVITELVLSTTYCDKEEMPEEGE